MQLENISYYFLFSNMAYVVVFILIGFNDSCETDKLL